MLLASRLVTIWGRLLAAGLIACVLGTPSAPLEAQAGGGLTENAVRGHMEMLASDALRGRGSGTHDEWVAATYIASQMRRLGLEPLGDDGTYLQVASTPNVDLVDAPTLTAAGLSVEHGRHMLVRTVGPGSVTGPLVRYRSGVTVEPGSVLLVSGTEMPPSGAVVGAAAVLQLATPDMRSRWAERAAVRRYPAVADGPWRIALDADAYEDISRLIDGTAIAIRATVDPVRTWNVLGRIPGLPPTGEREVVLLSAHLDHLGVRGTADDPIFNGADDDASGVTAVLGLAEALVARMPMRRTVIFALFGSEESGGHGARQFRDRPPVPLSSIVANLQFEMIGRPDPALPSGTLWLTGYERTTLGPALARRGARIVADPHPAENFFFRSDNIGFAYRGVIAQTVSSFGLHGDYHAPSDDLSRIDFGHLTRAIRSMVEPVLWLANSAFLPEWRAGQQPTPR